ncbi:MAG: glutamine--tRNA ligase, partial [Polyangiaceae bacterium]|nr:glutamine--tRNA ligase [Polyangiaceae bacterium]
MTPAALRAFAEDIGVARTHNVIDIARLEHAIRDDLNREVPRVLCVLRPLKVVIENYPAGQFEQLEAPFYPHDIPKQGARRLPFERELFIDRDDFLENPPKGFFRLSPGTEVRLRYAYIIRCERVVKNETGEIVELRCTYDPQTRGGNPADGRKIKGTIHWVSASLSVPVEVRLYDRLFLVESPDASEGEFTKLLNPDSLELVTGARVEPSVASAQPSDRFQFERQGYFTVDPDSRPGALVFNRTVTLKDTWAKIAQRDESRKRETCAAKKAEDKSQRKQQQREAPQSKPEESPTSLGQKARIARLTNAGVAENDARLIGRDKEMTGFLDDAAAAYDNPREIAKWIVNELQRELKGRLIGDLPFGGAELGELVG